MARRLPYDIREYNRRIGLGQKPDYARRMARGAARFQSPQTSRGHREGRGQEHRVRAQRARAAGRLTERERAFLRRQVDRPWHAASKPDPYEMEEFISRFEDMSPTERETIMARQHYYQRRYRSKRFKRGDIAPDFGGILFDVRPFYYYH